MPIVFPDLWPELLTPPAVAHAVFTGWITGTPASEAPFLKPEHFHDHRDQAVWRAILELDARGMAGDLTALEESLKRTGNVDYTNWHDYMSQVLLDARESSPLDMAKHAETVYENWRRLQMYRRHINQAARAVDLQVPLPAEEGGKPGGRALWTVEKLYKSEFPEPRGLWPGIIPPGLTVIGARPKYGKSMLMLQVSAAVGGGGMLFGKRIEQAPVLYYALEDSPRRLKERLRRLDVPEAARIDFACEIRPLHLGGIAEVEAAACEYGLIVLDTITRATPGQDLNREAALYGDLLGRLQSAALNGNMSIVVVLHTRKPNGMEQDPIDDVLGSTQMTAAADAVLAIYRKEGRSLLKGRGREMEDVDLTMEFDPTTVCWQLVGPTAEVRQTENEEEIMEALREVGRGKVSEIAEAVGKDRTNTRRRLNALWLKGKCKRDMVEGEFYYYVEAAEGEKEEA